MKLGYTWKYKLVEQTSKGMTPTVIIDEELWHTSRSRSEQVISPYPGGEGRQEDSVADSIRDAFLTLAEDAHEFGVEVHETVGPWQQARWIINDCTLDSGIVKTLMTSLSALNRVTVAVPKETAKKNK